MQTSTRFPTVVLFLVATISVTACGGGSGTSDGGAGVQLPSKLTATFVRSEVLAAVEAQLEFPTVHLIDSVSFTVHTKPGGRAADLHVTYARAHLDRTGAIDAEAGTVRFPVFGLYRDRENELSIRVTATGGAFVDQGFTIDTREWADPQPPMNVTVDRAEAGLDVSFLLLQAFDNLAIIDIDGEVRWRAPPAPDALFPRMFTPQGLIAGATSSSTVYRYDWLGRFQTAPMSDARCVDSHHNFAPGREGILNTVSFRENDVDRGLSVLAEMTADAVILRIWDFDKIFTETIATAGEDPSSFIRPDFNWFHMNSAIYDASDDTVIVSSRENFVVKADYTTGAIRWLLGNPGKQWFTDFPLSLQPLALTVIGDPPIGQHSLSVSPDGRHLMLFDNGAGNFNLPDVGDTRGYSKATIYEIDEDTRTATEIWTYDQNTKIYSAICSSAYPTPQGNVIVTYAAPWQDDTPLIEIVDRDTLLLFRARIEGPGCFTAYATESVPLEGLEVD